MNLQEFFQSHPRAALAFSGGADSAFLLKAALDSGAQIRAYYVQTEFQTAAEQEAALQLARQLGADVTVLHHGALDCADVRANGPRRCYHCKKALFTAIGEQANRDGFDVVLEGTNGSDDVGDRPGWQALQELGVLSPLRLCGLTKPEIRRMSRKMGLPTWDKPASACLATRIPTGTPITRQDLRKVEQAETAMKALGFRDFRVRLTVGGCRLEVTEAQMGQALARRAALVTALSPLLGAVTLDLTPRQPSVETSEDLLHDQVAELQCNLDDMTGEDIGFAVERLLEAGALDVWTAPIYMKKNRPAVLLTCLCPVARADEFAQLMLRHTTTLGVRRRDCGRTMLHRSVEQRGGIRVKTAHGGGIAKEKAEFDDLAALARQTHCSLAEARKNLQR